LAPAKPVQGLGGGFPQRQHYASSNKNLELRNELQ